MTKLTADRLRELVSYDPATGEMRWRVRASQRCRAGDLVGSAHVDGYRATCIEGRACLLHRVIWLYVHGEWPVSQIDHINGDRADNRLANLRPATPAQQTGNTRRYSRNTSGVKGVSWYAKGRKWHAQVGVKHLGYFDTKEDAADAYQLGAAEYFGEYASHLSRNGESHGH